MRVAYLDASWVVAIALGESGHERLEVETERHDRRFSSGLLEAELWSACRREGVPRHADLLSGVHWVLPDRPLSTELGTVLDAGYVRGADAWHLACALFLAGGSTGLAFLTLDRAQGAVARALGFETPLP